MLPLPDKPITMSNYNVSSKEFGRRYRKALSVPFLLEHVCSNNVQQFVNSYSQMLGCTDKSFFFPLLTCAASCMGTESYIELVGLWKEPPIIWSLVLSPKSLLRIDVAEHIKQQLLKAQNETWILNQNEDTKDYLKKFLFDMFTLEQLQEMLKLSNGHGLAVYNSARSLHKNMLQPEEADVMLRLHSGLAWFSDSRVSRSTVTKTRVNFAIISTPAAVYQTLVSAPNFQELFHQCFLTACSEESHVKFSQLSEENDSDNLKEIFISLLKLHSPQPGIVYRLSAEAKEKFSQIHDELTDKAKQMVRKNAHKVFQPALSYLGRLSLILHVLDNVIDAINYKLPVSRLTWNVEISANTVWQARELLGHIIEQRHALMEQTMMDGPPPKTQARPPPIEIVDTQTTPATRPVSVPNSPHSLLTPPGPQRSPMQNASLMRSNYMNTARRNLMNNRGRPAVRAIPAQPIRTNQPIVEPIIASVHSAGISIPNQNPPPFNPIISSCKTVSNNLNSDINRSPAIALSKSVEETSENAIPILLSRAPNLSILEIPEQDFIRTQRNAMKKLLKHSTGEITPSRCVQLKLTPDMTASDESLRYTPSYSRQFLKRLESLGFGICEGANNGNKRHFVFKKKKFSGLGDEQKKILTDLNISEVEYNKCFTSPVPEGQQNGGSVVCLE